MSEADRQRWNQRYREGAYGAREHPAAWLRDCLERIDSRGGRMTVLDLACGAGRNALHLATAGHRVYAVDIAGEALERGRRKADRDGLSVHWRERDLDAGLPDDVPQADLVLLIRYLDLGLVRGIRDHLRPGGYLIAEVHLQSDDADVAGPRNPAFRAAPEALRDAAIAAGLAVVDYSEGRITDPDGRPVCVARVLARRE